MPDIAIVTDSNSGITQEEAEQLGIVVVPMPFFIDDKIHFEGIDLSQADFYHSLESGCKVSTSQPSPGDLMELWKKLLNNHDELVYIPMSSGLSASCETAAALAADFNHRVFVVNNKRISVTMRQSILDALRLSKAGYSGRQIKEILEKESLQASIYLMVNTLEYLKKGGRITPAAAMIGTVLNLKPVLTIQGDKLDAYAKVRGVKQARKVMIEAMKKDIDTRFKEPYKKGQMCLDIAYSYGQNEAVDIWRNEVVSSFPTLETEESLLSLSVVCHTGPGVLAIACSKKPDLSAYPIDNHR